MIKAIRTRTHFGTFEQSLANLPGIADDQLGIQLVKIPMSIFDEKYRVVGIESDRLMVRGVHSGEVLTIINPEPSTPLSQSEYPVGKLIALSDPSATLQN
jgi:hypothetical protein